MTQEQLSVFSLVQQGISLGSHHLQSRASCKIWVHFAGKHFKKLQSSRRNLRLTKLLSPNNLRFTSKISMAGIKPPQPAWQRQADTAGSPGPAPTYNNARANGLRCSRVTDMACTSFGKADEYLGLLHLVLSCKLFPVKSIQPWTSRHSVDPTTKSWDNHCAPRLIFRSLCLKTYLDKAKRFHFLKITVGNWHCINRCS